MKGEVLVMVLVQCCTVLCCVGGKEEGRVEWSGAGRLHLSGFLKAVHHSNTTKYTHRISTTLCTAFGCRQGDSKWACTLRVSE